MVTSKKKVVQLAARRRDKKSAPVIDKQGANIRVSLEPSIDSVPIYANHVEVGHTRHEFTVLVGRVPGKLSTERFAEVTESGQFLIEPEATILLPPTLVSGLIRALQTQLATWEEKFGPAEPKEPGNA